MSFKADFIKPHFTGHILCPFASAVLDVFVCVKRSTLHLHMAD